MTIVGIDPGPDVIGPILSVWVPGIPASKGSMRAYNGRLIQDSKRSKPWALNVTAFTAKAIEENPRRHRLPCTEAAILIELTFCTTRPKSAKNRPFPTVKPDVDKLSRNILDALKGLVWLDDKQVVDLVARKRYADAPGVHINVFLHAERIGQ